MSLLNVQSNAQLDAADQQAAMDRRAANDREMVLDGLAGHVRKCYSAAKNAKQSAGTGGMRSVNDQLLSALRARQGEYEPDKLAKIRDFGGSETYARITSTKIRGASAWIKDIYLNNTSEKPWTLQATPDPALANDYKSQVDAQVQQDIQLFQQTGMDVPPEMIEQKRSELLQQAEDRAKMEAKEAAARMEMRIQDQMLEGGAYTALSEFIDDLATFKTAILKAPIVRKKRMILWENGVPVVKDKLVYSFATVSPFDFYPAPGISRLEDGYCVERHRAMTRSQLYNLIGVPGYSEEKIRAVLDELGTGGLKNWLEDSTDTEREKLESKNYWDDPEITFDVLEFTGSVQGKMLTEWGMTAGVEDELAEYEANVWVIGRHVIRAQLNPDPMGRKQYFATSMEKIPGAFWGNSVHDHIEDCQDICNSAIRSLVNNMAIASGPQVWVNVDRLPPGQKITKMHPWKIWQTTADPMGSSAPPAEFFQPQSNANELMAVFEKFYAMADDISGIPRYMIGNEKIGGAGRTASGLSMLMDAANKLLKLTLANIDRDVIQPLIEVLFTYNMLYNPDPSIKGDVQVIARGAISLSQKEILQQRRNEFLTATANPLDSQILGMPGRAALLREAAKGLDMPVDSLIPSVQQLQAQQAQMEAQAQAEQSAPDEETEVQHDAEGRMVGMKTKRKGAAQ